VGLIWVSLKNSSGIFEGSCQRTVSLDHLSRSAGHSSDVSYKGHTKAKFLQDVIEIREFHTVISRSLSEDMFTRG
jgi:hypothetical protein